MPDRQNGDIPRIGEDGLRIMLDLHILLFTLGISILTGIVFGFLPAITAARANLATALNEMAASPVLAFEAASFVLRW
jgi:putative ABC transport system permease protein